MLGQIWNSSWGAAMQSPKFKRWIVRRWYEYFSILDRDGKIKLMNYGYDDGCRIPLETYEESSRYAIQLYHRIAAQVDLRELDVLEVGSGRGGGAAYVMRVMRPRTYIGVDISKRNIAFCRQHYRAPGLHFKLGDAEDLDFRADRFDAVINIESSSHYGDIERFFREVHRVLRPGGYFLYADTWQIHELDILYARLERAGLTLLSAEDLGPRVFKALDKDSVRREGLIRDYTPNLLHGALAEFAGTRGSTKYEDFRSGKIQYLCCLLQKKSGKFDTTRDKALAALPEPVGGADALQPPSMERVR